MMVECMAGEALADRATLPRGTLLRTVTAEGKVGLFATTRPLTLLPLSVESARLHEQNRRLFVRVRLRAHKPQKAALSLPLHVRRLDDFRASLALHDALARHLVRAFAVPSAADGQELGCRTHFGAPPLRPLEDEADDRGPLARIRSFFHHPEQDLFVHVDIPATRAPWSTLDLFFELDEAFPSNLSIASDSFRLHVVPAENAWIDFAEPILWDGTQVSAPVRSANPLLEGVEPCGVRGVYKATDRGLLPLLPAALAQGGDTYEIEDDDECRLVLSIEGAFEQPCKVLCEARFSQPVLWSAPPGKLAISLQTRHLPGVTFRNVGPMRAPRTAPLAEAPARCLDVLSLRMRPTLGRRDLAGMLEILGAGAEGPFRGFAALVDSVDVREAPDPARGATGVRWVYEIGLRQRSPEDGPLVRTLGAQIAALLDAWTEDAVEVRTTTRLPPGARPLGGGERT
jgi:type VI secretion system protein ImpG